MNKRKRKSVHECCTSKIRSPGCRAHEDIQQSTKYVPPPTDMPVGPWETIDAAREALTQYAKCPTLGGGSFWLSTTHNNPNTTRSGRKVTFQCGCMKRNLGKNKPQFVRDSTSSHDYDCKYMVHIEESKEGYVIGPGNHYQHTHPLKSADENVMAAPKLREIPEKYMNELIKWKQAGVRRSIAQMHNDLCALARKDKIEPKWTRKDVQNALALSPLEKAYDVTNFVEFLKQRDTQGLPYCMTLDESGSLANVFWVMNNSMSTWMHSDGGVLLYDTTHGTNR